MGVYRTIDTRIWNDGKFRKLSDKGKLVWFLLLTHPNQTPLGAFRATIEGLAAELGMDPKGFREGFAEAFAEGMVEADEKACCILIPKFTRYNKPANPNVVKSWVKHLDRIPECELLERCKSLAYQTLTEMGEPFTKAFAEAFGKPFAEPFANPSPKQEQGTRPIPIDCKSKKQLPANGKKAPPEKTPAPRVGIVENSIQDSLGLDLGNPTLARNKFLLAVDDAMHLRGQETVTFRNLFDAVFEKVVSSEVEPGVFDTILSETIPRVLATSARNKKGLLVKTVKDMTGIEFTGTMLTSRKESKS